MHLDDTIVAIATPAGRGGIGVVRLSGSEAKTIARPLLRLAHTEELQPNRAHFGELIEPATGDRIDEVVVTFSPKPHSYTTDDVVEISCHGSPVVLRHVVEMALSRGARLAEPGEFTMRAFLNGRIDLTQAEAVRDLIDSQTLYQAQVAARQLEGALSNRLQPIKQKLVELIAVMEAGVDFAEDDVSVIPDPQILQRSAEVHAPLHELLASFAYGKVVHEGLTLAIVGRPNVGKSSLFNRLVEHERAIVTATPGTTRDLVSETVSIGGIPVRLVDTAGIRDALDEAESIGVRKSMEALADADVVLLVVEAGGASAADLKQDVELMNALEGRRHIAVVNKVDLVAIGDPNQLTAMRRARGAGHPISRLSESSVFTAATTGEGIDQLRAGILELVRGDGGAQLETGFLTNVRQQKLVQDSISALDAAVGAVHAKTPHEMILLDLYNALRPLDEITGATTADDILNLIFSSFCIGK
ncbi:MAG TPA: tRNA uridine-5-carboxymethylaminomethyl(34) synthesis GTPase MnmE [Terriglobales bacterium]